VSFGFGEQLAWLKSDELLKLPPKINRWPTRFLLDDHEFTSERQTLVPDYQAGKPDLHEAFGDESAQRINHLGEAT
jgi:hypothetical protein